MSKPIWITAPGLLGSVYEDTLVDFNLSVGSSTPTEFYIVSGDLPPGVVLSKDDGIIHGTIPVLKKSQQYDFSVRAYNQDGFSDRWFSINVLDFSTVWGTASNLGTIVQKSFYRVVLSAVDLGNTSITFDVVSGELPSGLTLEKNGIISGYVIPINSVYETYTFTIRANGEIPSQRTFSLTVTQIGDTAPNWNTIGSYKISNSIEGGNIGVAFNNNYFSFQLVASDTIGSLYPLSYTLSSGTLPPGISLSLNGLISGTLLSPTVAVYAFVITVTDGFSNVSRGFYIKTNFYQSSDVYLLVPETVIPVDLETVTTSNSITFDEGSQTYNISNTDIVNTFEDVFVKSINDIYNLPISSTLLINVASETQYYVNKFYNGTSYNEYNLLSITTGSFVFDLGKVDVGEKCSKRITAISPNSWVRYNLMSGNLPFGLELNPISGDIYGVLRDQPIGDYLFNVRAYNDATSTEITFKITVEKPSFYKPKRLTTRFKGYEKIKWEEVNSLNIVPYQSVYRTNDKNYDEYNFSEVVILSHVDDNYTAVLNNLFDKIPAKLTPDYFVSTPVTDTYGQLICEAVVLRYIDSFRKSYTEFYNPVEKNPPNSPRKLLKPGGLEAIRHTLITNGLASDTYEDWMGLYFWTSFENDSFYTKDFPHGFLVGDAIVFQNQVLPSPFENDIIYFVIPIDGYNFKLAISESNAINGVYINFNPNVDKEYSGTLKTFFAGSPVAYIKKGESAKIAATFNSLINKTPFGYYSLQYTGNTFDDTFFMMSSGHQLLTGDPISFTDDIIPQPFVYGQIYYAIKIDNDSFQIASSKQNAIAGIATNIVNTINDQTSTPYTGSFKKIKLTSNNNININEVDLRFSLDVDCVCLDDKFLLKDFTASSLTDSLTIQEHSLETGIPITFINQTLDPALTNDVEYYAIVIDNNTIKLASTYYNAFANVSIPFTVDFSGLVGVDRSKIIYINKKRTFSVSSLQSQNCVVTTQTDTVLSGDAIVFSSLSNQTDLVVGTVYYAIPIKQNVFSVASSLVNAQNGVYIPLTVDFTGEYGYNDNRMEPFWQRYS